MRRTTKNLWISIISNSKISNMQKLQLILDVMAKKEEEEID